MLEGSTWAGTGLAAITRRRLQRGHSAFRPKRGLHELVGDRKGTWSMTVARNYRLTFRLGEQVALIDLNIEHYLRT